MKYRLTEDWLEYKKGHVFEMPYGENGSLFDGEVKGPNPWAIANNVETSLLLKTGILEEVKEEEWPIEGCEYWIVEEDGVVSAGEWNDDRIDLSRKIQGNYFRRKSEALEASEKIKTLLLSLKK